MNYKMVLWIIGNTLKYESICMIIPLIVSLIYKENITCFVISIIITFSIGVSLAPFKGIKDKRIRHREGFFTVSLCWIVMAIFGALPYFFSGLFPTYIDCFFEAVSGFTTTGATILTDIESIPKGILFWRNLTIYIGGMGVLLFMMAILPSMKASSVNLMIAESTGPNPSKIVPKIKETAKIMYLIYFSLTILQFVLLFIAGLSVYDALLQSFSTAGTGGFSNLNNSIGGFNNVWAEIIITVFMFLFGINFSLYFFLLRKDFKSFYKDEEFIVYLSLVIISVMLISFDIYKIYGSFAQSIRYSSFHVSSMITSTGFATTDFNLWPNLSKSIIILLMFTGCCAGSTGGGIKIIRFIIMFKAFKVELSKMLHPRVVKTVTINGKRIDDTTISKIFMFLFIYFGLMVVSTILISFDKSSDMLSNITGVITCLSNMGPGLEIVGPSGNFAGYNLFSKLVFSFCMLAGRLEFLPVLLLLIPAIWRRGALN